MKLAYLLVILFLVSSCIPVKIAPRFTKNDYKIMHAKKFKRKLPRETSFIFKDPKKENEFYNYVNTKYKLDDYNVGLNTPIQIDNETYYLTYSEIDKDDETLNLVPILVDKALETDILYDAYTSRKGHWYLILTVYDDNLKNCLLEKHPKHNLVLQYLKELKNEYLTTHNYQEVLFKKKP